MLKSTPEVEALDTKSLTDMLIEARDWLNMSAHEQYHSRLYKLTSILNEVYGGDLTVYQCVDIISVVVSKRFIEENTYQK